MEQLLVLVSSLALASAGFSFSDCGKPDAAVKIVSWSMPSVIENGNRYPIRAVFNVSRAIPAAASVSFVAQRNAGKGYEAFTHCYGDMGTCQFGVCARPGHPATNPLFFGCNGVGAAGVVPVGVHSVSDEIFFPGLSSMEIGGVHGDFKGVGRLLDAGGSELGCWNLGFSFQAVPSKC